MITDYMITLLSSTGRIQFIHLNFIQFKRMLNIKVQYKILALTKFFNF
jgi:hypothetical protein